MKRTMRLVFLLVGLCLYGIAGVAFSKDYNGGYYATYEKSIGGGSKDIYVLPQQVVSLVGFFPPIPIAYTPDATGFIFSLYPDGSIGNVRSTTSTWKDAGTLGLVTSTYKVFVGEFRAAGMRGLLLQGSGSNHSFVIGSAGVTPYVYHDFGNALNSQQYALTIGDFNNDGRSDLFLKAGGNTYLVPGLGHGQLFDMSALAPVVSGPATPTVSPSTAACYAGVANFEAVRNGDLNTSATQIDNSPEIAALARTLGYSPLAIYEYVYNRIEYEPYKGAEQGALATLKARRGNDVDHASLLIALLRASKIPARYVSGTVYLEDMPSHYYWHKTLNFSGMNYAVSYNQQRVDTNTTYLLQGRQAIKARHVWVEACVPYENYRGTRVTDSAGLWLPLDAGFKRYMPREGVVNTSVDFDYAGFLAGRNKRMPLELYVDDLLESVRTTKPDATLSDLGVSWQKETLGLEFLPDSLPYQVQEFKDWSSTSTVSRFSTMPDSWVKYSRIVFEGQAVDVPYSAFANGRVTLSFQDGTVTNVGTYLQNATPYTNYPGGDWHNIPDALKNATPQTNFLQTYRNTGQAVCTGPTATVPVLKIDGVVKKTFADLATCLPYASSCETKRVCSYWTTRTQTVCTPSMPTAWHDINGNVHVVQNAPVCSTFSWPECSGGYHPKTTCDELAWAPLRNTYSLSVRPRLSGADITGNAVNYDKKISPLEYYALQVYTHNQSDEFLAERFKRFSNSLRGVLSPWNNPDAIVGEYLHIVGRKYIRYVDEGNRLAGRLLGETGQMFDAAVLTSLRSSISFIYDTPFAMFSDGYLVDAFGITNSSKLSGGTFSDKMLALSGINGSAYESYIWQENANSDAISTVTGLQIAQEVIKPDPQRPTVEAVRTVASAAQLRSFLKTCPIGPLGEIPGQISKCYSQATVNGIASWFTGATGEKMTIPREVLDIPGFYGYVYLADAPNAKTYAISQSKGGYSIPSWNNSFFDMGSYSGNSVFNWSDYDLTIGGNDSYSTGWHYDLTSSSTDWSKYTSSNSINSFDWSKYDVEYFTNNSLSSSVNSLINFGNSDGSIWSGDPVNMVTGNMYHTETDLSATARGLPLLFQRAYNSRDVQQDGPLGPGWTHSFNQSLKFVADGATATKPTDVIWKTSDGGRRYIKLSSSVTLVGGNLNLQPGIATAPKGYNFTLTRPHASGQPAEFLIKEKSGIEYRFVAASGAINTEAKLKSITDANGNKITLNYDSLGRLASVIDPDNRSLTFAYDGSQSHIIGMTWGTEQHEYEYSSAGTLITYRNPVDRATQVATTTYSYYSTREGVNQNFRMKGFSSADGAGMTFEYYPNGKVYRHYNNKGETQIFNYNDYRRESIATDERGNKTQYLFNVNGLPLEITGPNGAKTSYLYENTTDPLLRSAIIDPMGQKTGYVYDSSGNLTQETLPSGKTNKYFHYNAFGKPQLIKNAADDYRLNLFDAKGNLIDEIIFVKGFGSQVVPGTFNATANAANILAWTKKTYDAYGNVSQSRRVRDFAAPSTGPSVGYVYTDTANGTSGVVPTQITYSGDINGDGTVGAGEGLGSYNFTYDRSGRLKTGFNERLYSVQFVYDLAGKKIKGSDGNGQLRDYNYDAAGRLINESLTAKSSGMVGALDTKSFSYDELGRLSTQTNAAGAVTKMEYDATGNLIATTSPDGYVLRYEFDESNRMIGAQDQKGNTVRRVLDATGRVKTLIDPNGYETSYVYYGKEQNGRLRRVTDAEARWTQFEYDALGQVTRTTAGKGANTDSETLSEYDALGRVTRVVKDSYIDFVLGVVRPVTTYTYNSLGYRTVVRAGYTNAAGDKVADQLTIQASVTYDDFGRLLTSTDALGQVSRVLEYDAHGNALRSQDANGNITSATYGYGGVLLSKITSGIRPTRQMRVTRNALGQPTRIDSDAVSYTYGYDDAHRVSSITDGRANKAIAYSYSMGGLLNQICQTSNNLYCDGADITTTYMYDPVGRMTSIRTPDNTAINFSYDAAGRLVEKSYPNLVQEVYEYFKDGRLKNITLQDRIAHNALGSTAYTYDDGGRLATQDVDQYGGTIVTNSTYGYDGVGRLQQVNSNWYNESVSYDPYGNRRTHTTDITGTSQTYAYEVNDLHQILKVRQNTLTGTPVMSFTYDANGNLATQNNGSAQLDFAYSGWNEMMQAKGAGGTESYQYDHNGLRIAKSRGSDVHRYLLSGPDIVADYNSDWSTVQARFIHGTHMDEPLMMSAGNDRLYMHGDSRGSIGSATGSISQGNVSIQMMAVYSAWGEVSRIGRELPFGYAGREHDASGLVYMRARYYQPQYGRFTQQDPAGFVDGVNRYTYALNSPVNYVDPWGTTATKESFTGNAGMYVDPLSVFGSGVPSFLIGQEVGDIYSHNIIGIGQHGSVRIYPDNPNSISSYMKDNGFDAGLRVDGAGKQYIVFSGGPDYAGPGPMGNLYGDINRRTDLDGPSNGHVGKVYAPPGLSKDSYVMKLLDSTVNYNRNPVNYDFLPDIMAEYNSNSYFRGLIESTGGSVQGKDIDWRFQGFNKPVPASRF